MKKVVLSIIVLSLSLISCKKEIKNEEADTKKDSIVQTTNEDTSKNTLDWAGVYEGTVPCASCPGIHTVLELNENGNYLLKEEYLEEKDALFHSSGKFTWDRSGRKITLEPKEKSDDVKKTYLVGENVLIGLDFKGEELKENTLVKK